MDIYLLTVAVKCNPDTTSRHTVHIIMLSATPKTVLDKIRIPTKVYQYFVSR